MICDMQDVTKGKVFASRAGYTTHIGFHPVAAHFLGCRLRSVFPMLSCRKKETLEYIVVATGTYRLYLGRRVAT
jgi:hypothetical protein